LSLPHHDLVTSGGATASNSKTKVAGTWVGILYRVRGAELFLEARYIDVASVSGFPKTTFLPIAAGIRLGSR